MKAQLMQRCTKSSRSLKTGVRIPLRLSLRCCPLCVVSAQCLAVSWTSTLEALTWPFLTTRTRSLRVKPITSVDSGQTTSSTQVSPESH